MSARNIALALHWLVGAGGVQHRQSHRTLQLPLNVSSFSESPQPDDSPFHFAAYYHSEHPHVIGFGPEWPNVQHYEAYLPRHQGVILNIYSRESDGEGGLMLALEVPSPCADADDDDWMEVDHARCSSRYPCALRLPAHAVSSSRTSAGVLLRFRTRVLEEFKDYETRSLYYERLVLETEPVLPLARLNASLLTPNFTHTFTLPLSRAAATGALSVMPVVRHQDDATAIYMRIRQKSGSKTLPSWAWDWRSPEAPIAGCSLGLFEVVADQLFPGEVEVEVAVIGSNETRILDVMLQSRVLWAEAERRLLSDVLEAHLNLFRDPDALAGFFPAGSFGPDGTRGNAWSNPTEWGYTLSAWAVMAELGLMDSTDVAERMAGQLEVVQTLQQQPEQFAHGLFFPFYFVRELNKSSDAFGEPLEVPARTQSLDLSCGDAALYYASLSMVRGWLLANDFNTTANLAHEVLDAMNFSRCVHQRSCGSGVNLKADPVELRRMDSLFGSRFDVAYEESYCAQISACPDAEPEEPPWAVTMTVNAEDVEVVCPYDWSLWADEGGSIALVMALAGAADEDQYRSIVEVQRRNSPCVSWQNTTVRDAAFFNSVFMLPTRSVLGLGTLFASDSSHDFSVRTVLPSLRAQRVLKEWVHVDYVGAGAVDGGRAFFPPNVQYDNCAPNNSITNRCTWCADLQYLGTKQLPQGLDRLEHSSQALQANLVPFLAMATMERSQARHWIEELKLLMTDASDLYSEKRGFEILGPVNRSRSGGPYFAADDGFSKPRGFYEVLPHAIAALSVYEGLASQHRRYELLKEEGAEVLGSPPSELLRPLSDFLHSVPHLHEKLESLLEVAEDAKSASDECPPSAYRAFTAQ